FSWAPWGISLFMDDKEASKVALLENLQFSMKFKLFLHKPILLKGHFSDIFANLCPLRNIHFRPAIKLFDAKFASFENIKNCLAI
ncbi:MAG: hypothetical protein MJ060_04970, partial [Clostridia bacterium]|nr:hypothetical protein [Clostridia bacterium]